MIVLIIYYQFCTRVWHKFTTVAKLVGFFLGVCFPNTQYEWSFWSSTISPAQGCGRSSPQTTGAATMTRAIPRHHQQWQLPQNIAVRQCCNWQISRSKIWAGGRVLYIYAYIHIYIYTYIYIDFYKLFYVPVRCWCSSSNCPSNCRHLVFILARVFLTLTQYTLHTNTNIHSVVTWSWKSSQLCLFGLSLDSWSVFTTDQVAGGLFLLTTTLYTTTLHKHTPAYLATAVVLVDVCP